MQCGRLHHEFGNSRGKQSENCKIRGLGAPYKTRQVERYEGAKKCYRGFVEHDTLGLVPNQHYYEKSMLSTN